MNKKVISFISHLAVFVVIEILFVFVLLHEFPKIGLFEKIGIVHAIYWVMLILAGIIRKNLEKYRQRFLATYIPIVFHIIGHIYVGMATIESIDKHHHEDGIVWIIIATGALGIMIFIGEWLIHRKFHCDIHHGQFHKKHCQEE